MNKKFDAKKKTIEEKIKWNNKKSFYRQKKALNVYSYRMEMFKNMLKTMIHECSRFWCLPTFSVQKLRGAVAATLLTAEN